MDPLELRLKNAAREGTRAPYGPNYRAIGYAETLEAAKKHPHYQTPLGPDQGRGVASGFWFNAGMQSTAAVSLNEDGTAVVVSPNPDIGGSRASLAIMAAEELGIDVEKVRPVVADTETIGYSDVTGGSRVTFATGMAVVEAARDVVRQLRERAAALWSIDVEDVEWREGEAHARNGASGARDPLPLAAIVRQAARTGGPRAASVPASRPTSATSRSIERPARCASCATRRCRTSVARSTRATSRGRCRGAPPRGSAGR
jgi:CO/xanthine dehydrogenase Mo-binding subunit